MVKVDGKSRALLGASSGRSEVPVRFPTVAVLRILQTSGWPGKALMLTTAWVTDSPGARGWTLGQGVSPQAARRGRRHRGRKVTGWASGRDGAVLPRDCSGHVARIVADTIEPGKEGLETCGDFPFLPHAAQSIAGMVNR
jgi:hypothetical protein